MQNQQVKVELTFKEYPSIQLSTRDKFINKIKSQNFDQPDILWVASQKIHGSNFSIHYSGQNKIAKYGRRTDFLSKQIPVPCENPGDYFNQAFYDARNTVKKFHNHLDHVFQKIKQTHPETEIIQIYGEYFGGSWPENHPNYVKGPKAVQKGVYYTPYHEFMVFDIKVTTPTSTFWIDVIDIPKFLDDKFMHIPVYAKGTFQQVFAIQTVIDSTIPEILGLQRLQKNIIEGMVLRPNKSVENSFGERVMLKKKNEEFNEKASAPKGGNVKEKKQKALDPELVPFIEKLTQYLNFNRIQSVTSKFPDVKDRNKIKQQVCKDVYSDADKDEFKWSENEEINKKVKTEFDKLAIKEINSFFIKH